MDEPRLTPVVRRVIGVAVAVLVAIAGWLLYDTSVDTHVNGRLGTQSTPTPTATTATTAGDQSGLPVVSLSELPREAADTVSAIDLGGPFRYDRDGVTFENREGLLPGHETGYYHEYTVETPGSDDRGARRVIAGSAGELYYTDDHYESFVRITR